jgi:hypothetical protein
MGGHPEEDRGGMNGLTLEQRFANHKAGIKPAHVVKDCGVGLKEGKAL